MSVQPESKNKFLIVVIGPTASGKTAMAIQLAKYFDAEIVSADSRQFFKEIPIGTAAPTPLELAAAPHHFIRNLSLEDTYTVGHYEADALARIDTLFKKNSFVFLTGGSGLYIDAVLNGLDKFPPTNPEVREKLKRLLDTEGIETLQKTLQVADPEYYQKVDTKNPQRMMRALEVCLSTGKPYSSFLNKTAQKRNFTPVIIGLNTDRKKLYQRINQRVDHMLDSGLEAEVKGLMHYRECNALQTVGYREWFDYFDGNVSYEEVVESIKQNTRRYAKRQLTWFRRYDAKWFDVHEEVTAVINYIEEKCR
ncbi:MAG: tRNA (adenosine(37)-N6)-dimethylallyltransferase MiaA [Flavobacteriaceae bacterium]|nr:tRNA (adenosine(37)-N6)-dimethylallyltransferase MiaA [Flavobacteriaceae bacterium]